MKRLFIAFIVFGLVVVAFPKEAKAECQENDLTCIINTNGFEGLGAAEALCPMR